MIERIKRQILRRLDIKTLFDLEAVSKAIELGYMKMNGTGDDIMIEVTKKGIELIEDKE